VRGASKPHLSLYLLSEVIPLINQRTDTLSFDQSLVNNLHFKEFWEYQIDFIKKGKRKNKVSKELKEHLSINVLVPYLGLRAIYYQDDSYYEKAIDLLDEVGIEKNAIITKFKNLGFEFKSAIHTQGAIELNNEYCIHKKCINCHIGKKIIQSA